MERRVPFIDLIRAYSYYSEELEEAALRVLRSGVYLNGSETEALERELADYLGVNFAIGVSSGTEALYLILRALDLTPQSCVLLPSFTFVATAEVVVRAGLRPVFVDIEPDTPNISVEELAKTYKKLRDKKENISAVIAVSIFGYPAKLIKIAEFCREHGLYLIEDICQAFGASIGDKKVGTFGIASATSFYPTKSLSAFGDAGMVFTNDKNLYEKIRILKEHGQSAPYYYTTHGINGRIDEIQCALLRVKFKYFEKERVYREKWANFYRQELKSLPIKTFITDQKDKPVLSLFSLRVRERDELKKFLEEKGVSTRIYYPVPLHLQPVYQRLGYIEGDLPETERLCKEILSLPFFPYLSLEEAKYVVDKIKEFYGSSL
ncbi:MAG: DegT/DnrJ/EryC1/StrS family aminotransferase [Caldimicrobium sp.]